MKLLTILCSSDLGERVQDALIRAGAEGFLHVPSAVGFKPGAAAEHGRWPRYPAEMYVAPVAERVATEVLGTLGEFAGRCDVEPCLKIVVSSVEKVY